MDTKGLTGVLGDKWGDSMNKEEAKKEALALVVAFFATTTGG